jgi:hypothetical protein
VVKLGVGKSSEVLGLNHGTISGERSDKAFSLPSQTRRGKLNRNTPKIQSLGNSNRRYKKRMKSINWSSYRIMKFIRNTWFNSRITFMKGLSFSDNFLWVCFRCCSRKLWGRPRVSASGSHN